jgi:hypothetical protein
VPTGTLLRIAVDGTGEPARIGPEDLTSPIVPSSVHGAMLLAWPLLGRNDVLEVDMPNRRVRPWLQTKTLERNGEISPDGRWVVFEANTLAQPGQFNIYVRPLLNPGSAVTQISTGGGTQPAWSRDGAEIFYIAPDGALMSARVEAGATLVAFNPRRVIEDRYYYGVNTGVWAGRMYDVSKDDRRFLMIKNALPDRSTSTASILVTQHWLEELKQLVPAK